MTKMRNYLSQLGDFLETSHHNYAHKKMHIHHQPFLRHPHEFVHAVRTYQANGQSLDDLSALKDHFDKINACNFSSCALKRKASGELCHICKCSRYD